MKKLLLIGLPLLLIVGCSKEPINYETTLIKRDGVFYTRDNKPYSGPVFSVNKEGFTNTECNLKDGKMITYKEIYWWYNGQKSEETTFNQDMKRELNIRWYETGEKYREANYKTDIYTEWYKNGQKRYKRKFKDGKEISLEEWNEDGSLKE